jgi:electron transport complex protein RnfC
MKLRSFFGILPPKIPYMLAESPVEMLDVPEKVTLLCPERTPADLVNKVGDSVITGQDLARNGKSPFLSTVTGQIQAIADLKGPDGNDYVAVTVKANAPDSFDPALKTIEDIPNAEPVELRSAINRAGFHTLNAISIDPSLWPPVDVVIISALDLDPLSIVNQQTFRDQVEQVEAACQLLSRSTGASRCVLAVPENLSHMTQNVSGSMASVVLVPAIYPNGLPEILARKYGGGLLMRGNEEGFVGNTVVVGVEHAMAMVPCLHSGKPLLEKTITFSSTENGEPRNFRVRIGTPVADLLHKVGIEAQPKDKLILNGMMNGYTCFSDGQPITSTVDSVYLQRASQVFVFQNAACTNCGKCNTVCPVDLEASLLGRLSEYAIFDKCLALGAENCVECGLCAYVCPARRPLVQFIVQAKLAIKAEASRRGVGMEEPIAGDTQARIPPAIKLFEALPQDESSRQGAGGKAGE